MKHTLTILTLTFMQTAISIVIGFITPLYPLFILCGSLVLADTLAAIYKTVKSKGWAAFSSRKLSVTLSKTIFYLVAILLAEGVRVAFEIEIPLPKLVVGIITTVELKSLDEHFKDLYGFSLFSKMLEKFTRKQS